jgi:hypothetical protein
VYFDRTGRRATWWLLDSRRHGTLIGVRAKAGGWWVKRRWCRRTIYQRLLVGQRAGSMAIGISPASQPATWLAILIVESPSRNLQQYKRHGVRGDRDTLQRLEMVVFTNNSAAVVARSIKTGWTWSYPHLDTKGRLDHPKETIAQTLFFLRAPLVISTDKNLGTLHKKSRSFTILRTIEQVASEWREAFVRVCPNRPQFDMPARLFDFSGTDGRPRGECLRVLAQYKWRDPVTRPEKDFKVAAGNFSRGANWSPERVQHFNGMKRWTANSSTSSSRSSPKSRCSMAIATAMTHWSTTPVHRRRPTRMFRDTLGSDSKRSHYLLHGPTSERWDGRWLESTMLPS